MNHIESLDDFFNLLPVALYRTSIAGELLAANHALALLLGYESVAALMAEMRDVNTYYVDESVRSRWVSEIESNGRVEELDFQLTRLDGSTIWVRDTGRVASSVDGSVLYFEGALVDVSEKVRLRQSQEEFIATVSHELRNPISVALGLSREMVDAYDSFEEDERRKMIEMVARESEEAAWLIEDLLVAYHDDRRELSLAISRFEIGPEIDRILSMQEARIPVMLSDTFQVAADPGRTRQILRNLLSNALRYGGDQVHVEVVAEASLVVIRVCDNGDAIDDQVVDRIFEPFGQEMRRPYSNSVGLGLPVSRKLARLMGGDVTYSYRGRHSCFSLLLPKG